ncbi:glycerophosphodiester phosphodiesterase [Enterococcus sp. HY326]|uniref:glycerophosphodiester phosphodiesterase n=1 Tax=Enterococcus sp. HY326 TaxID=2971265 RepID=UPI00223F26DD|nr:glycerophosphodiester phosphodiesterase [Enterococcus sp. HY326]
MALGKFFRQSWHIYRQGFGRIILLNVSIQLFLVIGVSPLLNWMLEELLRLNGIDYVSFNNVMTILEQPLLVSGLLVLFFAFISVVYCQFAFMFLYFQNMLEDGGKTWGQLLWLAVKRLKKIRLGAFFFLTGYFILIFPFGNLFLRSSLLSKVVIPTFIFEYLLNNLLYMAILALFFLIVFFIGLRLLFILPEFILTDSSLRQAIKASFQKTKKRELTLIARGLLVVLFISVVTIPIFLGAYYLQNYLDKFVAISFYAALVNLLVLQLLSQFLSGWGLTCYLMIVMDVDVTEKIQFSAGKRRWLSVGILVLFMSISTISYNASYLLGITLKSPVMISHRGVNGNNGVQNTIPALLDTIKSQPDFVEMDIHETKDLNFVVMHDENLRALTGVNQPPHNLTLEQLTALTASENGHSAKVASFADYFAAALAHNQKLLIEIKTTKMDSPDYVANFLAAYGDGIAASGSEIHSLDYAVVQKVKELRPDIFVSFILPFNLSFPNTDADAYTMEETTLTDSFIQKAALRQKKVYAWTVNESDEMESMLFLGVDGMITDDLTTLKQVVKDNLDEPSYATRILSYLNQLNPNNSHPEN